MGLSKNFKTMFLVWLSAVALALLALLALPQAVMASELVTNPDQSITLMQLLALFVGSEQAAQWFAVLGLLGYLFTQLRAWIPADWLAKLPRWVVVLMERAAGNYRKAGNEVTNNPDSYRKSV